MKLTLIDPRGDVVRVRGYTPRADGRPARRRRQGPARDGVRVRARPHQDAAPPAASGRRSTTADAVPGQRAGVDPRTARRRSAGTSASDAGSRPPGWLALVATSGRSSAGDRAGHRGARSPTLPGTPRRRRRSGPRGRAPGRSPGPAAGPQRGRPDRGVEPGEGVGEGGLVVQEDLHRLRARAALQGVERLHARGHVERRGQAVDRVGRDQRDLARQQGGAQGGDLRRSRPPPAHHPCDAAEVVRGGPRRRGRRR